MNSATSPRELYSNCVVCGLSHRRKPSCEACFCVHSEDWWQRGLLSMAYHGGSLEKVWDCRFARQTHKGPPGDVRETQVVLLGVGRLRVSASQASSALF